VEKGNRALHKQEISDRVSDVSIPVDDDDASSKISDLMG